MTARKVLKRDEAATTEAKKNLARILALKKEKEGSKAAELARI